MSSHAVWGPRRHPSASLAARRVARGLWEANQMGGWGCCTGGDGHAGAVDVPVLPVEVDFLATPQELHDLERLIEAAEALGAVGVEGFQFKLAVAQPDA